MKPASNAIMPASNKTNRALMRTGYRANNNNHLESSPRDPIASIHAKDASEIEDRGKKREKNANTAPLFIFIFIPITRPYS